MFIHGKYAANTRTYSTKETHPFSRHTVCNSMSILAGWEECVLLNVEFKMNWLAMYLQKGRVIKSAVGWESREWLDLPFQSGPRGFSMSGCGILGRRAKWKFNYWIPAHATYTQLSLGARIHKGALYVVLLGDNEPPRYGRVLLHGRLGLIGNLLKIIS